MTRLALLILMLLAGLHAQAGRSMIPRPYAEPARLEAARRFVAALPIAEGVTLRPGEAEMMRGAFAVGMDYHVREQRLAGDFETFVGAFNALLSRRVDQALPQVLPAALEDIAVGYALDMQAADLDAAARFFATPQGRALAARIVARDRLVYETLQAHLFRFILPDVDAILAEARVRAAEERRAFAVQDVLRRRVNAAARRRN